MTRTTPLGVGLVGSGFLARTRARCYRALPGGGGRLVAVTSRDGEKAAAFAREEGIPEAVQDLDALLARDDIQLVDLCVPNHLHRPFTERVAAAGKAVACTKPLTAYVGQDLGPEASDAEVSAVDRRRMAAVAIEDARAMVEACERAGVPLLYGENWVHAPAVRRAAALLEASGGRILDLRGWESHSGSHSPYSKLWRYTGGGSLIRLAAHPIGAMLHLKALEGLARDGKAITAVSVVADTAEVTAGVEPGPGVATGWVDVESWGSVSIAFSDGTRGLAMGSDTMVGGMQSRLVVLSDQSHLECNLSPNDALRGYGAAPGVFGGAYVMEKAAHDAGWHSFIPDEDASSGHLDMCADFVAAAAGEREGRSTGQLGYEVTRVVMAAYVSAAEGRRVTLDEVTP
jgi:predicted dehydrogenase